MREQIALKLFSNPCGCANLKKLPESQAASLRINGKIEFLTIDLS